MISKIFGKPCQDDGTIKSKFARFIYYFFMTFYFIAVVLFGVSAIFNLTMLPFVIIVLVIFPFLLKGAYSLFFESK